MQARERNARPGAGSSRCIAERALVAFALALLCGTSPAHGALWTAADTLSCAQADAEFGWSIANVGDIDRDGFADLAVGAHHFIVGTDTGAGAVFLYTGGLPPGSPPFARLDGLSRDEHFGESVAGGRDIDGDGIPDLAVGAPLRAVGAFSAAGAVDVFRGGAAGTPARWTTVQGEAADDWFGQSVAMGDLDGDGRAELIVGAPYNDRHGSAAGAVFIYHGSAQAPLTLWKVLVGEAANDQFGWSVTCPGDVDGDGYGDVAVGARLHGVIGKVAAGRVYLFRGGPSMDTIADGSWTGEAANDWFGQAVASPGDVDGGGRPDILVGAPYNDRNGSAAGAAYLFRGELPPGSIAAAIYVGETANAQFGWALTGGGDINGDGLPDVLVGARFQPVGSLGGAGRVYAFAGGTTLSTTPIGAVDGEAADDWMGQAVGMGPGFFDSGRAAALAGAPLNDHGGDLAGRAYALGDRPTLSVGAGRRTSSALRVSPVPARTDVQIDCAAVAPGALEVTILDVSGRAVSHWTGEAAVGGLTRLHWDARDDAGVRVPAGLYFVRIDDSARATASPEMARIVIAH